MRRRFTVSVSAMTFNNWLRFDVTGEYRGSANFHGADVGYVASAPWPYYPDNYSGSKSEWTFLTNGYVDLGTWNCITPFVGAGIGVSRNTISNFTDMSNCGTTDCGNPASIAYFDSASKWSFAWASVRRSGLSGVAQRGRGTRPIATSILAMRRPETVAPSIMPLPYAPFEFNHLTSSDVRLGLRFNCCEVPPAAAAAAQQGLVTRHLSAPFG